MLIITSTHGRIPFISQRLMKELIHERNEFGLSLSAADVSNNMIRSGIESHVENGGMSIRSYFGLDDKQLIIVTPWDGLVQMPDNSSCQGGNSLMFMGEHENVRIQMEDFCELCVKYIKPSWIIVPHEVITPEYSAKHIKRALERCETLTKTAIESLSNHNHVKMITPILGCTESVCSTSAFSMLTLMKESCDDLSKVGLLISSYSVVDNETRLTLVNTVRELCSSMGQAKLPLYACLGSESVEHIIDALAYGIDYVETTLPFVMTKMGYVLSFTTDLTDKTTVESINYNIQDSDYEIDTSPLVEGCDCFACKHHTKGYVHHLYNAQELLGSILLYKHNITMLLRLCDVVEASADRKEYSKMWKEKHSL